VPRTADYLSADNEAYMIVFALLGILAGLILTPYLTIRPLRHIRQQLVAMPPEKLVAIIVGIFLGLIAAALISLPLAMLPSPFENRCRLTAAFVFCYLSVVILMLRQNDLKSVLSNLQPLRASTTRSARPKVGRKRAGHFA
jgi:uncharacterized protein YacL